MGEGDKKMMRPRPHGLRLTGAVLLRKKEEHQFLLEGTWAILDKMCPVEKPMSIEATVIMVQA